MANLPASFERTGGSKAVGCLVYAVSTPFVALFLAIFLLGPIQLALQACDAREYISKLVTFAVYFLVGLGTMVWAVRDYRRRADYKVTIQWDRIVVQLGSRRVDLPFAEVASIRLVPAGLNFSCVLLRQRGTSLRLSPEVAPFNLVRDALEETLISELVRRLDHEVGAGELVAIRENIPRSLLAIAGGLFRVLIWVVLILNPLRRPLALAFRRCGILMIRQGWLGLRGGFVLNDRGLCPRSNGEREPIPWDRLDRIHMGDVGLILRSRSGHTFGVSALSENFWPVLRWINARLPPGESKKSGVSDWR